MIVEGDSGLADLRQAAMVGSVTELNRTPCN